MLRTFQIDDEVYNKFKATCSREGEKVTKKIAEMIEEYVKEHADSNNPQTLIEQFDKESVLAIPTVYADPKSWEKFFGLIKNFDEYKELDEKLNMVLNLHNKKRREFD